MGDEQQKVAVGKSSLGSLLDALEKILLYVPSKLNVGAIVESISFLFHPKEVLDAGVRVVQKTAIIRNFFIAAILWTITNISSVLTEKQPTFELGLLSPLITIPLLSILDAFSVHLVSSALGGRGKFLEQFYGLSKILLAALFIVFCISIPTVFVAMLQERFIDTVDLIVLVTFPLISLFFLCFTALFLYSLYVRYEVVKGIQQLPPTRAFVATLASLILTGIFFLLFIIAVGSAMEIYLK